MRSSPTPRLSARYRTAAIHRSAAAPDIVNSTSASPPARFVTGRSRDAGDADSAPQSARIDSPRRALSSRPFTALSEKTRSEAESLWPAERRERITSMLTAAALCAFRSSWPARRSSDRIAASPSASVVNMSVTQIGVVGRRFDSSKVGVGLWTMNLHPLDEPRDDLRGIGDRKLGEQK